MLAPTDPAPSPSGPLDGTPRGPAVPVVGPGRHLASLRLSTDLSGVLFRAARRHPDVFALNSLLDRQPLVITSHPDHVRSLLTADPAIAPSVAGESPVRPVVGISVLTATGEVHRRQRRLLMPSFHGAAIARYRDQIVEATERELARWRVGETIVLARSAQAITLDVIMSGVFGIDRRADDAERALRDVVRRTLRLSVGPLARAGEFINLGRTEAVGPQRWAIGLLDRAMYDVITARRRIHEPGTRHDILSLLLDARDEDGDALTDQELRNELLTLVLAGHETTANSIAWAFERLVRAPTAHDRLREVVRDGDDADGYLEATINETLRARPVVPLVGRRVLVPWHLGHHSVPTGSRVLIGILLLHHREDLYPDPRRFSPDRFVGGKPGTYAWLPFGGGNRRCLGAALAMEELRIVVREVARRADLVAVDDAPEKAVHRNVTMIPGRGGRVRLVGLRP